MNEAERKKSERSILGLVLLIAALFAGVKLVFAGLDAMLPDPAPVQYAGISDRGGQYSGYSLRVLDEEARQGKDIQSWLARSREELDQEPDGEKHAAFWLYRMDIGEYLLYLPEQERTLEPADFTAVEEGDEDGETVLVLRARTGEKSEEILPEEQLLGFITESKQWRGIRLRVILDGRELNVHKLASQGGDSTPLKRCTSGGTHKERPI